MSSSSQVHTVGSFEKLLECGEVVFFEKSPFTLPSGEEHLFLLQQSMGGAGVHKNISFNPHNGKVGGYARKDPGQKDRLQQILRQYSNTVIAWVSQTLTAYHGGCEPDRVSFRPEEEATRRLRMTARNDLLHVDAFPGRPARGRRILRVFANINKTEPRVWATSDPLPRLMQRYGKEAARSSAGWFQQFGTKIVELLTPWKDKRADSDWFMLKMHDYLKCNNEFQQRTAKKLWHFPPGSVWLAMTDACSHAVLRGQYALEHSFFIAPHVLVHPELTPDTLLRAA